ncbi:MAG: class I SAM-dependent methyltransferase [Myxococcota bacterium]
MASDARPLAGGGSTARLLRHYDAKYGAGTAGPPAVATAPAGAPQNRHEACLHYLPQHFHGGAILEVGAGDGRLARGLAAQGIGFERYVATEASRARLAGLERSLEDPRFEAAHLDLEQASPEHDARYDAVILLALVEHLVDPIEALQRVRGFLKPGGIAFIDTPNVAKYTRRLKLLFGRFPATASRDEGLATFDGAPVDLHDEGHLHYFTYRSLSRLLFERCGFREVTPAPYASGPHWLGRGVGGWLARLRPQLFSELCVVARA